MLDSGPQRGVSVYTSGITEIKWLQASKQRDADKITKQIHFSLGVMREKC